MDNTTLDSLGMPEQERNAYWQAKVAQKSHNDADTDKAGIQAQFDTDMTDLQTIIDTANPTNAQLIWATKRLAAIMKDVFLYHKDEVFS